MLAYENVGSGETKQRETANARFKRRAAALMWPSLATAVLAHYAALSWLPGLPLSTQTREVAAPATELLTLLPALTPPPPPPQRMLPPERVEPPLMLPPPPAPIVPVEPTLELDVSDVGFDVVAFDELPAPPLPPPALAVAPPPMPAATRGPATVEPQLRNREAVVRALKRHYPPRLQAAGIGGTVVMWFWIDEAGHVSRYELNASSGYPELDRAAERVIEVMEFSPALRHGSATAVVVELPIVFESR